MPLCSTVNATHSDELIQNKIIKSTEKGKHRKNDRCRVEETERVSGGMDGGRERCDL